MDEAHWNSGGPSGCGWGGMNLWREAEKLVAGITGGIIQQNGGRQIWHRTRQQPCDVLSGNRTRLQVKWSNPIDVGSNYSSRQWHWNVANCLDAEGCDRIILIGSRPRDTLDGCQIFDVPSEWIAAWSRRDISCGVGYNSWGQFGYQLYSWFISDSVQLAERYGPGKVVPVESRTPEQEKMFQSYKRERIYRIRMSLPRDVQAYWNPIKESGTGQ